jgi:hypothetical protein
MTMLVKTAQAVEDRVESVRKGFEPTVRSKLREARAEWFELNMGSGSAVSGAELRLKAVLLWTDARLRLGVDMLVGRLLLELEKVRRTLP